MASPGGGRARWCALALVCALLVAGCSEDVDQAHAVQTRLGRMDHVATSVVTSPTDDRGAEITLAIQAGLSPTDVVALALTVAGIAADEGYLAYRLTLRETGAGDDALVVDDDFGADPRAGTVVEHWQRLVSAFLGNVTYRYQPDSEVVEVATDGSLVHDAQEASRIGYGSTLTTWRFADGGSVYVDDGRLRPSDVLLLQRVQRTVASPSLPVPAPGWRLETRRDHVLLDLPVLLPGPVDSSTLTVAAYDQPLRSLAIGAADALSVGRRPGWLRLVHRDGSGDDDVFGWWQSDRRPAPGRDPRHRGWDAWLEDLAGA